VGLDELNLAFSENGDSVSPVVTVHARLIPKECLDLRTDGSEDGIADCPPKGSREWTLIERAYRCQNFVADNYLYGESPRPGASPQPTTTPYSLKLNSIAKEEFRYYPIGSFEGRCEGQAFNAASTIAPGGVLFNFNWTTQD